MSTDYERRMNNWALWRVVGGGMAFARTTSSVYLLGPRGPRAGNDVTVLAGEAEDTDKAVRSLRPDLQRVVQLYWVRRYSVRNIGRAMHCRQERIAPMLREAQQSIEMYLGDNQRKLLAAMVLPLVA